MTPEELTSSIRSTGHLNIGDVANFHLPHGFQIRGRIVSHARPFGTVVGLHLDPLGPNPDDEDRTAMFLPASTILAIEWQAE
jgi:hypothetical protein